MINRTFLVFALFAALLFSGCITITDTHRQLANGSAVVTQELNMSSLMALSASYGSSYSQADIDAAFALACANITKQHPEVKCTPGSGGVISLQRTYGPSNAFYKFETKDDIIMTEYRLTVDDLPQMYDASSLGSSASSMSQYSDYTSAAITAPGSRASASILKASGAKYEYDISMPGSITSAPGAKSFNSTGATFDVLQMMDDGKPIVVESQEINWLVVAVLAAIALVVLAAIALAVIAMVRK
jgi:hypothetical protein